jgi:hypothetical protein
LKKRSGFIKGKIVISELFSIKRDLNGLISDYFELNLGKNDQCGQPRVTRKCGARTDGQRLT